MRPELTISLSAVQHNVARISTLLKAVGKCWRPRLFPEMPREVVAMVLDTIANSFDGSITCSSVEDAEFIRHQDSQSRISSILIRELPANSRAARQVAILARDIDVIVAVDHFYHAELLSRAVSSVGTRIATVIEIDVGARSAGVRPGTDAARLCEAIQKLPALSVRGFIANAQTDPNWDRLPATDSLSRQFDRLAEADSMLSHSRALCAGSSLWTRTSSSNSASSGWSTPATSSSRELIAIDDLRHLRWLEAGHCVTEVLCGAMIFGDVAALAQTGIADLKPAMFINTVVCSRPSLPVAVIACGSTWLGTPHALPAVFHNPGASAIRMTRETTTFALEVPALDLTIGDDVTLIPPDAEVALRLIPVSRQETPRRGPELC